MFILLLTAQSEHKSKIPTKAEIKNLIFEMFYEIYEMNIESMKCS